MEAIVHVLSSKKNIVFYLFIIWVSLEKPCLKKSIEKPTEFHGVMRRIVICCQIHTGEYLFFAQTRVVYQIQLRAFFIGKFAILEFTPASSPILSSHRQVSHYCSHRQGRHSCAHIGKIRQVFQFISARFAKFELISARFAKFWVRSGKIRQFLSS